MTIEIRWNAELDFFFKHVRNIKSTKYLESTSTKEPTYLLRAQNFPGTKKLHSAEEIISLITMTKQTLL